MYLCACCLKKVSVKFCTFRKQDSYVHVACKAATALSAVDPLQRDELQRTVAFHSSGTVSWFVLASWGALVVSASSHLFPLACSFSRTCSCRQGQETGNPSRPRVLSKREYYCKETIRYRRSRRHFSPHLQVEKPAPRRGVDGHRILAKRWLSRNMWRSTTFSFSIVL